MSETSMTLQSLLDAMGERAEDLRLAPYQFVITEPLHDEPEAIDIKMLLGYTRVKTTPAIGTNGEDSSESIGDDSMPDTRHKVWIHLYPPQTPKGHPEIHFHEYTIDGIHVARLDGENISRVLFETAKAFTSPTARKWSKSKLVALAKYYFLRSLVESGENSDSEQVLRMPISKTFKDDLAAACRDLKDAEDIKKGNVLGREEKQRHTDSLSAAEDESDLSDVDTAKEESDTSTRTISGLPKSDIQGSQQDAMRSLLDLNRDESRFESDIKKISQDMLALQVRREILLKEEADIQKRMADMLEGMSAGAAFVLGRQVEQERANKRRRTK